MELRPPSIAHGVVAFIWGVALGAFVWVGLRAIGVAEPRPFIIGALACVAIFFFVRVYGEDRPRRSGRAR